MSLLATSERAVTAADFRRISKIVQDHCGINLHQGKEQLVQARLAKLIRSTGFESVSDYLDQVLADPDSKEFSHFIDSLSTNLTSFFREDGHFTYLAKTFLPELIARKRARGDKRLRLWSAACSSGEEPYTLAMVVLEALATTGVDFDVKILATDISNRVLRIAREGVYDRQRVAPVPPQMKGKYLVPQAGGQVAVAGSMRNMVRFAHLNLMESWPFSGPFDFIFCRNVMIYFDKPTQEKLVNRFYNIVTPGGLLFTGHSESLTGVHHKFGFVQATIYRRD